MNHPPLYWRYDVRRIARRRARRIAFVLLIIAIAAVALAVALWPAVREGYL